MSFVNKVLLIPCQSANFYFLYVLLHLLRHNPDNHDGVITLFHGQRSMAVYSPWGHKELGTTEHADSISCKSINTDLFRLSISFFFMSFGRLCLSIYWSVFISYQTVSIELSIIVFCYFNVHGIISDHNIFSSDIINLFFLSYLMTRNLLTYYLFKESTCCFDYFF